MINRDNFCQCVRISDIIILMSTIKAYFKFFVLLPPSPTLQCWLLAKESQETNLQHCNRVQGRGKECKFLFGFKGFNGGAGEGERSANFYLDLSFFFNVPI